MTPDELRTGICPRCDNRGGADFFPCALCGDRGFSFPAQFSRGDDALLKKLVSEGRPERFIALSLDPPRSVSAVFARISELGLASPRPEPAFVTITLPRDPLFGRHAR
jgi:hypothetical protein